MLLDNLLGLDRDISARETAITWALTTLVKATETLELFIHPSIFHTCLFLKSGSQR